MSQVCIYIHPLINACSITDSTEHTAKQVEKVVKDVLRGHFARLSDHLKPCLHRVAAEMYSCRLISRSVSESPTVHNLIGEFESGMQWKDDVLKLQEHCRLFLQCLSIEGGPAQLAAQKLSENWMREVNKECSVSLDLLCFEVVHNEVIQCQYLTQTCAHLHIYIYIYIFTFVVVSIPPKRQTTDQIVTCSESFESKFILPTSPQFTLFI